MEVEKAARSSNAGEQTIYIMKQRLVDPEDLHPLNLLSPNDWFFPSDFALSLGLLADLGIFKNVETFFDIRSNF